VKFEWASKCEESFQQLKKILASAPISNIADPNEDFFVCIDACKEGLSGFLNQKDHVVCYESRKLKEHERNYANHDLELEAIIHALKMWRHYLMGNKFEIRIDHFGMKHMFGKPILNAKKTRWLEFLSEYDFEIKHIRGKENEVVDALNRRAHEVQIAAIKMYKNILKQKWW
jgi:ribonuclease HI